MTAPTFETSDLSLTAYLHAKGFPILAVHWSGPKATFILEDRGDRLELVRGFYNGALVGALVYWTAIKTVKAMLYGAQEAPRAVRERVMKLG